MRLEVAFVNVSSRDLTHVKKACAYITRNESELPAFEGPGHDGLQIPKGTVEPDETPHEAVYREIVEESGLATFEDLQHLTTDVWTRRESPPKRCVRSFFRASIRERRDEWTHTLPGRVRNAESSSNSSGGIFRRTPPSPSTSTTISRP